MDIQEEREAFLNVFQFFKSFKGIGFSEDTEQFFIKKNKPNDAECLDVSNLNQMWRAWWARAKAQAVPEGFVLVEKLQLAQLMADMDYIGKKALGSDYVSFAGIAMVLDEAIEAQEQGHD